MGNFTANTGEPRPRKNISITEFGGGGEMMAVLSS